MPPPPLLDISTSRADASTTITVAGELDMSTLPVFLSAFASALETESHVVRIDTELLTFADSAAIQALVRAQAAAALQATRLELVNIGGSLERTLSLAGMDHAFETPEPVTTQPSDDPA
jgi:anti-anti-sigma factor